MSCWSHIAACIYLETDIRDLNIASIVKDMIKKGPQITGSEGNADIFVNALSGYDFSTESDCGHCPYGYSRYRKVRGGFSCCAPEIYECKEVEFQTSVAITIIGNLRDRKMPETEKEYDAFIKFLKENFNDIRVSSCTITDDIGQKCST